MDRTVIVAIVADLLRQYDSKMPTHQKFMAQTYAAPIRLHARYLPRTREFSLVAVFPNHHAVSHVRYEVMPDKVADAIRDIIEENGGDWILEVERQLAEMQDKMNEMAFQLGRNWK